MPGTPNGKSTLAKLDQKMDDLVITVGKIEQKIDPIVEQCISHRTMAEAHVRELYNDKGSRIYQCEVSVQGLSERLHAFVKQTTAEFDRIAKGVEGVALKRWDTWKIVLGAILVLAVNLISNWFVRTLFG